MAKLVSDGVYKVLPPWGQDIAVYLYDTGIVKCERCGTFMPHQKSCPHVEAAQLQAAAMKKERCT